MLNALHEKIRNHVRLLRLWVRNFVLWLSWDLRFLWLAALPVAIAYGHLWLIEPSGTLAKGGGLFLEALGILTVAWGLRETRKLFGRPTVIGHLIGWAKRFPRYRRNVTLHAHSASTIAMGGRANVDIWRNTKPGDPIEKRVDALEINLLRVKEELRETQKETNNRFSEQEKSLKDEAKSRSESDRQIEEKLEASETGGLHISATGLFWLLSGLPLTVFPNEIAALAMGTS